MVTAGVFLIIRVSPLFENTPLILLIIVLLGSLTAFFSATIGLTQSDLKKVIAYSTCSQLGYMVMICGFSYYSSGLFHLVNHGFFKALLFLSAGSIIHAVIDEQVSVYESCSTMLNGEAIIFGGWDSFSNSNFERQVHLK